MHCSSGMLRLVYEDDERGDSEVKLLRAGVDAFRRSLLALGGRGAWGQGWVEVETPVFRETDRSDLEKGLPGFLGRRLGEGDGGSIDPGFDLDGENLYATARLAESRLPPWSRLRFDLELVFDGPMLVAGPDREEQRGETDVAARFGHRVLACECKSGDESERQVRRAVEADTVDPFGRLAVPAVVMPTLPAGRFRERLDAARGAIALDVSILSRPRDLRASIDRAFAARRFYI